MSATEPVEDPQSVTVTMDSTQLVWTSVTETFKLTPEQYDEWVEITDVAKKHEFLRDGDAQLDYEDRYIDETVEVDDITVDDVCIHHPGGHRTRGAAYLTENNEPLS